MIVDNPTGRTLGAYKSAAKKVGCTLEEWMANRRSGQLHCRVCRHWLNSNNFVVDRSRSSGRASLCRSCASEEQTVSRYGMSVDELRELKKASEAGCPICGRKGQKMELDHNHDTGAVRAFLCSRCNGALGQFCDDIGLLNRAIEYLEKHDG